MRARLATTLLLVSTSLTSLVAVIALAGPLDPPAGPVSSTYRTLSEVEPGTPVGPQTPGDAEALYVISVPGRYFLTGNVAGQMGKHGIKIDADGVTLDLRGFALIGVPGSLDGVRVIPGRSGVTVRDGALRAWGGSGLSAVGGPNADGCLYQGLLLTGNGTNDSGYALDVGGASTVIDCMAQANPGIGIRGNNGTLITGCTASGNGGDGIICGAGTVRNCLARGNVYDGIRAGAASVISGCSATANIGAGITINHGTIAVDNACYGNGWGIYVYGNGCRMEANTLTANAVGVEVADVGNFIVRNSFTSNTTTEVILPGNDVGPFEPAATGTNPWGNLRQ